MSLASTTTATYRPVAHYHAQHPGILFEKDATSKKYSYRTCPICSERLLVRIHGSLVYKWIIQHFAAQHNEWLHVVVNLQEF